MQCIAHPTRPAANTCNHCGHWLCDECCVDVQGRLMCRPCLSELANSGDSAPRVVDRTPASAYKRVNWGLLFLFSCFFPPGANYMYMGLIKRGLAAMCGFFLIIYMLAAAPIWPLRLLFSFGIPVLWLTCIFDGFNIRHRINAGEAVPDGVSDIINSILRNKTLTLAILAVIAITFVGRIFGFVFGLLSMAIPILAILFGLYVLLRRKK
ncbi:MAG: hypothetical protein FWB91_07850 [Defluviitaleaceae bacterium]|nr:hypothetical protein [Defluviitaleaceae bacterium]